jgi:putative sterol carrier protein
VYELTARGQALQNAVLELGKWGSHLLPASLEDVALPSVGSCALGIKAFFRPEQAQGINETYELHLGNEVLQVRITAGELQVQQGEARKADVVFHTDMLSYLGLFSGQIKPGEAVERGLIRIEGDPGALSRFLTVCGLPSVQEAGGVAP